MMKRKAYEENMEGEMRRWAIRIDEKFEELRTKYEIAYQKLQKLKEAEEETWEDLKGEFEEAVNDLEVVLKRSGSSSKGDEEV
jgi:ElaB/YqjD/DUF883 family membrane-anchored ribosome-binding protein